MTAKARLLLVDDDQGLLRLLSMRLESAGYQVHVACSGEEALAMLPRLNPQVVITDLRMDGMDGMALFDAIRARDPLLPIVILTAHGTIPDAVEATSRGVFGFLTKPFDGRELLDHIARALRLAGGAPEHEAGGGESGRSGLISRSVAMDEMLRQTQRVADSEANVLIQGESGTGKELLARVVHQHSRRAAGPFLAINCGAMPEALLESELFGHCKGAFSGATQAHKGLFEAASGGTLFLDEVGDMPLAFQTKLLRVIQEQEVRPIGSTRSVAVDVRVISATHRDLEQAVAGGEFRADLFYRLNVVRLDLPPLRDRRDDIPPLVSHFLIRSNERNGRDIKGFSPAAMELLMTSPWPGNVRQLQNVVEQAVALATTDVIPETLVQHALRSQVTRMPSLAEAREQFERQYLEELLQITAGNVSNAARIAGRNRTEFYKLLRRHRLMPELFRGF
ncbi:MAG: sigma 54-interacting transcriptional regulator [Thiohalomonadaceae bacterium]